MAGFRKAERKRSKLRLGVCGPSGSGKTASSLLIAYGLTGDWEKIGVIDTENGSGELYVNATINGVTIGEYNVLPVSAPYLPEKYIEGIRLAEQAGIEVVIIDSLSHAWSGEGGLLDLQGKIASKSGNTWTAWRDVTPKHNALVEAMLTSKIHVIATMRSKVEHVQEKDERTGKSVIRKVGMAPIQREGMDYEMTVVFDLSVEHVASCSKDRTNIFDGKYFTPSPDTGTEMLEWLDKGAEPPAPAPPQPTNGNNQPTANDADRKAVFAAIGDYAREHGYDAAAFGEAGKSILRESYKVASCGELKPHQWAGVRKHLDTLLPKAERKFAEMAFVGQEGAQSDHGAEGAA